MFETWYKMVAMLQSGLDITPVITHHFAVEEFEKASRPCSRARAARSSSTGPRSPRLARRLAAALVLTHIVDRPPALSMPDNDVAAQIPTHRGYLLRVASCSCATTTPPRTSCRTRCSRRCTARGLLRAVERQDLAHRHPQAQDRRRDPPQDSASRRLPRRSTTNAEHRGLRRACSRTTAHWDRSPPADWGDPESALSRQQFFDIMELCLEKLPPNTARVFMMREVMELERGRDL